MPTYDYRCPSCGLVEEVLDLVPRGDTFVACPRCPFPTQMVKLPSAPAFVVNGFSAKNGYSK